MLAEGSVVPLPLWEQEDDDSAQEEEPTVRMWVGISVLPQDGRRVFSFYKIVS